MWAISQFSLQDSARRPKEFIAHLLAKHLNLSLAKVLDAERNIDESFVGVHKRSDLLVFGAENPCPKDAVKPNTRMPKSKE